jgi:hypothetical protein
MDRTTAPNYATVGGLRVFQDLNLAANQRGTGLVAADRTALQEELVHGLIEATGIAPNAAVLTQAGQAVKRLAGANVTTIAAAGTTTLTADNAGIVLVNAAAGAITIDLPAVASANGVPLRFRFIRTDTSANTVSIVAAGTDVFVSTAWGTVSAPVLSNGAPLDVAGDGVSHWIASAPAQKIRYTANQGAAISPAANSATYPVGSVAITFPAASRTGGFRVLARLLSSGASLSAGVSQNFTSSLSDGTNQISGSPWLIYAQAAPDTWGTADTFLSSVVYAPGATITFTHQVATAGGSVNGFSISGCSMELFVEEA